MRARQPGGRLVFARNLPARPFCRPHESLKGMKYQWRIALARSSAREVICVDRRWSGTGAKKDSQVVSDEWSSELE